VSGRACVGQLHGSERRQRVEANFTAATGGDSGEGARNPRCGRFLLKETRRGVNAKEKRREEKKL